MIFNDFNYILGQFGQVLSAYLNIQYKMQILNNQRP